jgi:putative RNA 2'-phosphotransferase
MKNQTKISKFISLILRHNPDVIGITLDNEGWADVNELLCGLKSSGTPITLEDLQKIVQEDSKQRYVFSHDGENIRAQQGHSTSVDLAFTVKKPPIILYHGTVGQYIPSIKETGLDKRTRQYVHLSMERVTAENVGGRRGKPIILTVQSLQMFEDGYTFFLSGNGVWLTDHVPSKYILFP